MAFSSAVLVAVAVCLFIARADDTAVPDMPQFTASSAETRIWSCSGIDAKETFKPAEQVFSITIHGSRKADGLFGSFDKWLLKINGSDEIVTKVTTNFENSSVPYAARGYKHLSDPTNAFLQLYNLDRCASHTDATRMDDLDMNCTFTVASSSEIKIVTVPVNDTTRRDTKLTCCAGDGCPRAHGKSARSHSVEFYSVAIERKERGSDKFTQVFMVSIMSPPGKNITQNGNVICEGRVTQSGVYLECYVPAQNDCFACKIITSQGPLEISLNYTDDQARSCNEKEPEASAQSEESTTPAIVGGAIAGVVMLAVVIVALVFLLRRFRGRQPEPDAQTTVEMKTTEAAPLNPDEEAPDNTT